MINSKKSLTKKDFIIFSGAIILLFFVGITTTACYRRFFASPLGSMADVVKDFEKNRADILIVRDYFVDSKYENLFFSWSSEKGILFAGATYRYILIDDLAVKVAIETLIDRGYRRILKREGVVSFLRFGNTDRGVGIAYSIEGIPPTSSAIQFLITTKPLYEPN